MKLYFYNLNLCENHNKKIGIYRCDCDVVETQKRYCKADKSHLPNYSKYVRKDMLGQLDNGWIILTEPNFALVKKEFAALMASKRIYAETEARRYASLEKIINESEEIIDEQ